MAGNNSLAFGFSNPLDNFNTLQTNQYGGVQGLNMGTTPVQNGITSSLIDMQSLLNPNSATASAPNINTEGFNMSDLSGYMGLATGALSLADMLNNWGMAKKVAKTNIANTRQQMAQSQEAFDRSVERQDRTRANIEDANQRSLAIHGG